MCDVAIETILEQQSKKRLWPVTITLEVIKRRLMVFCWSWNEGPLQ